MEPNVKIQVDPGTENKPTEIRYLTGKLRDPRPKHQVELIGTLSSVIDFVKKRDTTIDKLKATIMFDKASGEVEFLTGFEDPNEDVVCYTVKGEMIAHPYIKELGLNSGQGISLSDLIKKLKLNRRFFKDRSEHASLLNRLTNFSAKIEKEFVESNDYKGNVASQKIVKMKHEIPLSFIMNFAVYEGEEKTDIPVDIEVYPEGSTLYFALVSVDLAEKLEEAKEAQFEKVKEATSEYVQIFQ